MTNTILYLVACWLWGMFIAAVSGPIFARGDYFTATVVFLLALIISFFSGLILANYGFFK